MKNIFKKAILIFPLVLSFQASAQSVQQVYRCFSSMPDSYPFLSLQGRETFSFASVEMHSNYIVANFTIYKDYPKNDYAHGRREIKSMVLNYIGEKYADGSTQIMRMYGPKDSGLILSVPADNPYSGPNVNHWITINPAGSKGLYLMNCDNGYGVFTHPEISGTE
ncbi:MAG: hypothetical protein Q7U04_04560 [Bacteriovorax sp.]|nr:hypothetical protein [Bacteriovorax sp.]